MINYSTKTSNNQVFSILDHLDKLVPTKEKGKYICPVCEGHNFSVNLVTGHFNCFSGYEHCTSQVPKILNPHEKKNDQFWQGKPKSKPKTVTKIDPVTENITLAKISPDQWEKSQKLGNKTIYKYSDHQWIERVPKGNNDKDFFYCHLDSNGNNKKGKGDQKWFPYGYQFIQKIENKSDFKNQYLTCVEGQKDVETLLYLGLFAIDYKMINDEILLELGTIFKGLIFLPDFDKTGKDFANKIQVKAGKFDLECLIVELNLIDENITEKGDITDIFNSLDNDKDKLIERLNNAIEQSRKLHNSKVETINNDSHTIYKGGDNGNNNPPAGNILADLIAEKYREKLLYNNEIKSWLYYELENNGVWTIVDEVFVKQLIISELDNYNKYSSSNVNDCFNLLLVKTAQRSWLTKDKLIPFLDGVYNLETGKFEDHNAGNKLTFCLPRKYNDSENNTHDFISQWLTEVTASEQDKIKLIMFLSALLKGKYDLQKFLYLIGTGGSGKSTFTNLAMMIIGETNTISMDILDLSDKFSLCNLVNKKLVLFPDQDSMGKKVSNFKKLTGNDPLKVEEKFKAPFNYRFKGLSIVTSNNPIFHTGSNKWLLRRIVQISFNKSIPIDKQKPVESSFEKELSSFTKFLLDIPDHEIEKVLRGSQETTLTPIFWATQCQSDGLSSWLNDHIIFDPIASTRIGSDRNEFESLEKYDPVDSTLYGSYSIFCKSTGKNALSQQNFSQDLIELCNNVLNKSVVRSRGAGGIRIVKGIRLRLKTDDDVTYDEFLEEKFNKLYETKNEGDNPSDNLVTTLVTTPETLYKENSDNSDNQNQNLEKIEKDKEISVVSEKNDQPKIDNNSDPVVTVDKTIDIESSQVVTEVVTEVVTDKDSQAKIDVLTQIEAYLDVVADLKTMIKEDHEDLVIFTNQLFENLTMTEQECKDLSFNSTGKKSRSQFDRNDYRLFLKALESHVIANYS